MRLGRQEADSTGFVIVRAFVQRSQLTAAPVKDSDCSTFGLITVLSRVRLQRSFGIPIAPRNISSWIPLLLMRSRPTGLSALNYSLYDRPARRGSSQSHRRYRGLAAPNSEIQCPTQTEPSPQGPLRLQRPMQSEFVAVLSHPQVSFV